MKIVLFVLGATIIGCSNIENNNNGLPDSSLLGSKRQASPPADFTKDSVITIKFTDGSSTTTVYGKMNGIDHPVTVYIPVSAGQQLTVRLEPEDSAANIRINQLFMPDGKADGPFGKNLSRKMTQKGDYKLIVGENLMQGDEWKGKFMLTVKVE